MLPKALWVILCMPTAVVLVAANASLNAQEYSCASNANTPSTNGIVVNCPKIYDTRALTLMLDDFSSQLKTVQVIDQKTLAAALGTLQGSQSHDVTTNTSVSTLPTPGLSTQVVSNTGVVDSNGNPLPNTSTTTNTATTNSITPTPPTLDAAQSGPTSTPNYGVASTLLFDDQVNLTYQIYAMRMLLQRSLSDRLLGTQPRLQAVLGVDVSITPPRVANDAVAAVEITLRATNPGPVSLVSLMPEENAYNAATLSTKSHAFGGSAIAKVVQIGYAQRRSSKVFYLYRDIDMIAYQKPDPTNSGRVIFGWMFRPVLGQRAVAPIKRQLFAVIGLPDQDQPPQVEDDPKDLLRAKVRTFWKKYDATTLTAFDMSDANRARKAKYALSLELGRPEIFDAPFINSVDYSSIPVYATATYERHLRARVDSVSWQTTGSKSVLISANGENFFTGTSVVLGDKTFAGSSDGLFLKSNETFDLATTLDSLNSGAGAIIGRYGGAVPLRNPATYGNGVQINSASLGPALGGYKKLTLNVSSRSATPLSLANIPNSSPILSIAGKVIDLPYEIEDSPNGSVQISANVQDSVAGDGGIVKLTWPFYPTNLWTSIYSITNPDKLLTVSRLSDKTLLLSAAGTLNFDFRQGTNPCWTLISGDQAVQIRSLNCPGGTAGITTPTSHALTVKLPKAVSDKIILISPDAATYELDVPKSDSSKAATATAAITVMQFDAPWVDLSGKGYNNVGSVEANGMQLQWKPKAAAKDAKPGDLPVIQVHLTQAITSTPSGNITITVMDKSGKDLGTSKLQITCLSECKAGGK